jgi:hypothetical protein
MFFFLITFIFFFLLESPIRSTRFRGILDIRHWIRVIHDHFFSFLFFSFFCFLFFFFFKKKNKVIRIYLLFINSINMEAPRESISHAVASTARRTAPASVPPAPDASGWLAPIILALLVAALAVAVSRMLREWMGRGLLDDESLADAAAGASSALRPSLSYALGGFGAGSGSFGAFGRPPPAEGRPYDEEDDDGDPLDAAAERRLGDGRPAARYADEWRAHWGGAPVRFDLELVALRAPAANRSPSAASFLRSSEDVAAARARDLGAGLPDGPAGAGVPPLLLVAMVDIPSPGSRLRSSLDGLRRRRRGWKASECGSSGEDKDKATADRVNRLAEEGLGVEVAEKEEQEEEEKVEEEGQEEEAEEDVDCVDEDAPPRSVVEAAAPSVQRPWVARAQDVLERHRGGAVLRLLGFREFEGSGLAVFGAGIDAAVTDMRFVPSSNARLASRLDMLDVRRMMVAAKIGSTSLCVMWVLPSAGSGVALRPADAFASPFNDEGGLALDWPSLFDLACVAYAAAGDEEAVLGPRLRAVGFCPAADGGNRRILFRATPGAPATFVPQSVRASSGWTLARFAMDARAPPGGDAVRLTVDLHVVELAGVPVPATGLYITFLLPGAASASAPSSSICRWTEPTWRSHQLPILATSLASRDQLSRILLAVYRYHPDTRDDRIGQALVEVHVGSADMQSFSALLFLAGEQSGRVAGQFTVRERRANQFPSAAIQK